jgi:hypothetical protein
MRRIPLTLIVFVSLALAACLPVSSRIPAGATVGFKPDPALLGTWKARGPDGDEPGYIHFLGNDDGSMTAVLITPPQQESLGDYSVYRLHVATLGANHIVNAQEVSNNGKPADGPLAQLHMLLLYRAEGPGKITLYQMDDKAAAACIKAGEIVGEVEPGQDGDVRITADAAALDAFMRSPRAGSLFSKSLVTLSRVE